MNNKVKKWEELSREEVFSKYGRKIEKVIYKLPDGTESDFYIKKEGPAICVLALTKNNEVILAKQFRPGPDEIILDDELYSYALEIAKENGRISTSLIQRKLRVGYARAARLLDLLEENNLVEPADGAMPRKYIGE